ncbi:hypothetical protein [Halococcus sp. IIIV-5B]|nr:hypothetical protein [Halococcus sp. IIIV-5B]
MAPEDEIDGVSFPTHPEGDPSGKRDDSTAEGTLKPRRGKRPSWSES